MTSMVKNAALIVLEGIDGSGKSTLGRTLAERLHAEGRSASWHPNRNLQPVRDTLDEIAWEQGYAHRFEMLGRDRAQFLAAVLKFRDLLELEPELARENHVVVLDRYYYTHLALAEASHTGNGPRLRRLYRSLPVPDATLLLDVTPRVALERVQARGTDSNSLPFLTRFAEAYRGLPETRAGFVVLDADQRPEEVLDQAWKALAAGPLSSGAQGRQP